MLVSLDSYRETKMGGKTVTCTICGALATRKDLCEKHYQRFWRNGSFELKRPADWGARSKHPQWERWKSLQKRANGLGRAKEWDDFWRFVKDVSPMPDSGKAALVALRDDEPIGPDNWAWKDVWSSKIDRKTREGRATYMREWNARNPGKSRQNHMRQYGMTLSQFDAMAEAQNGVCAICRRPDPNGRLHIDHIHGTKIVRELLCKKCNTAIGLLDEDQDRIFTVIQYLAKHKPKAGTG